MDQPKLDQVRVTAQPIAWRQALADIPSMTKLAAPLAATQMGQLAINTTDVLMLGWLGPDALAASAITMALFVPFMLLGIGTTTITAALVAEAIGKRDLRTVRRAVRQGLWASVIITVPSTIVLWRTEDILLFFGQAPELAALGGDYMAGLVWSLLPAIAFVVFRGYVSAYERTAAVLLITGAAIIVNAIVNYGLIFGAFGLPAWGMFGAGIGSTITSTLSVLATIIYCMTAKPFRRHVILGRFWRADWPMLRRIFYLGLPIGFSIVLETSVFGASSLLMGRIGTLELAAHQIALQLASITFMAPLGIAQAATVRVGQAYGRRNWLGAHVSGFSAIFLATLFMCCSATLFVTLPTYLIWPFLDGGPDAATVMGLAVGFLLVAAAFQVVDGIQVAAMGALRGIQDTHGPMWLAAIGYWVIGFPTAIIFGFYTDLAGIGIWLGLAAGLLFASVALAWRFAAMTNRGMAAA